MSVKSTLAPLSIEEILRTAREAGASDVHLAAGIVPKMRVNGGHELFPAESVGYVGSPDSYHARDTAGRI